MPVLPILCVCEKAELLNAVRYVHLSEMVDKISALNQGPYYYM